jgi:hypothetical protein
MSDPTPPSTTPEPTPVPETLGKLNIQTIIAIVIVAILGVIGVAIFVAQASPTVVAIVCALIGTIFMTVFPFIVKKANKDELKFDVSFIITMLIAGIISTTLMPLLFINNTVSISNNLFIGIGTFGFSATINYIINAVASHILNDTKRFKALALSAGATITEPDQKTRQLLTVGVIAFLIFCLSCSCVFAAVTISKTVTATGNITAVGDLAVFSDSTGTTQLTNVNWGNLAPGSSVTVPVYIKNAANYQMVLSFTVSGYNPPSMASTSTVSWNYVAGTIVAQGNIQRVDLTFTAANNAPAGSFSFNIIVTGTQTGP